MTPRVPRCSPKYPRGFNTCMTASLPHPPYTSPPRHLFHEKTTAILTPPILSRRPRVPRSKHGRHADPCGASFDEEGVTITACLGRIQNPDPSTNCATCEIKPHLRPPRLRLGWSTSRWSSRTDSRRWRASAPSDGSDGSASSTSPRSTSLHCRLTNTLKGRLPGSLPSLSFSSPTSLEAVRISYSEADYGG